MKRIGIFAGTFDPVHKGHIAFCVAAAQQCNLEKVYLLPERYPRTKKNVTHLKARVAQLQKATQDLPELEVLILDDDYFTTDSTLPKLQEKFGSAQLVLLIGSDIACESIMHWPHLTKLLSAVDIAVGVRGNSTPQTVDKVMQQLQTHASFDYCIIDSPHPHVSSSQLRHR